MQEAILLYGMPLLFLLMVSNGFASVPPSELILSLAGVGAVLVGHSLVITIIVAVAGNLTGALLLYFTGRLIRQDKVILFLEKIFRFLRIHRWHRAHISTLIGLIEIFVKTESVFLLLYLRCLPVVRSIVSLPAGFAKVPLLMFVWLSGVGMSIWATCWIYIGAFSFDAYQQSKTIIWVGMLLLVFVSLLILKIKVRKLIKSLHHKT